MAETIQHSLLADLYDEYVRVSFDVPFFLKEARQVEGEILELMSGTGRVSLPLIQEGIRLTCVDYSPEMLSVLKRKAAFQGLEADIHCQDVRELSIGKQFDLIFIPFNSFAEILSTADRKKALSRILSHLSPRGTFICTLHNPNVRLRAVDGQMRLWGNYPLRSETGKLLLWGLESYDAGSSMVKGLQFFEEYDQKGLLRSKRLLETQFAIIHKDEFEDMAQEVGYKIVRLLGDYSYADYLPNESPFMIWFLQGQR